MVVKVKVKQGTIVCHVCRKVIDKVDSPVGDKTWFRMCPECSKEKKED